MKPPFRWVGGKTRLLPIINHHLPETCRRYFEPMVGGGALFFDYADSAEESYLMDINRPLMCAYRGLRNDFEAMRVGVYTYSDFTYDELRDEFNRRKQLVWEDEIVGCLFIMLNHLCFNGLYRENKKGGFNVPRGDHGSGPTKRPRTLASLDWDRLQKASDWLQGVSMTDGSCLEWPGHWPLPGLGDVVFYDPAYAGEFSDYNAKSFTLDHHRELHRQAQKWAARGAHVIMCGSNNEWSWKIYGQPTEVINVRRTVGCSLRGDATEALYVYPRD